MVCGDFAIEKVLTVLHVPSTNALCLRNGKRGTPCSLNSCAHSHAITGSTIYALNIYINNKCSA